MKVLEEFWYGNLNPMERPFQSQRKFDKAFRLLTKNEEELLKNLNEQEKELFDKVKACYDESKYMKLKKYFEKVDWNKVTSNLEKLPYYAFNLEKHTEKALVKPVPDENLFEFANDPSWKEKLNPDTLKKVESIIADYEEALRRVRQIRHTSSEMKRKTDIIRILFARGRETEYSVEDLYTAFDDVGPSDIQKARKYLSENMWQFTPSDEREQVIYSLFTSAKIYRYTDLFCDFSESGYRVLGDIVCDIDDMYRAIGLKKNLLHQKGDTAQLKTMLAGVGRAGDYKVQIKRNCMNVIRPIDRNKKSIGYEDVVKCAVALGKSNLHLRFYRLQFWNWLLIVAISTKQKKSQRKRGGLEDDK